MSVRIMTRVWDALFPTRSMKLVALKLADCANDDGENIYPSVRRVERDTGVSTSSVREALADMEASGLLAVIVSAEGNKRGRSSTVRAFELDRLGLLETRKLSWRQVMVPAIDPATGAEKTDADGAVKLRRAWRLVDPAVSAVQEAPATVSTPVENPAAAPPMVGPPPSDGWRGAPPTAGGGIEEPSLEPSLNIPPLPPTGGSRARVDNGGTSGGQSGDKLIEALRDDGIDEAVLAHLIGPVVEARRISGTNGNPRSALRDVARAAKGLGEEALRRAAADVLDSAPVKVRMTSIIEAVAQAQKSGARVVIQSRTPQWAAWERHFVDTAPETARTMRRFTGWQVPSTWPPDTPAPYVEQGAADCWWLSWGTPEHAAALAVLRSRDAAAAQAADVSQRRLEARSRWPQVQAQTTGEAVR